MSRLNLLLFAICTIFISGCELLKISQNPYYNRGYQSEQDEVTQQNQQQLNTAASLLEAKNPNDAQNYIDAIDPNSLSAADLTRLQLLQAQISLSFGETEQARKYLRLIQSAYLTPTDKITYLRSRAIVLSLIGKPIESVKSRMTLEPLLSDMRQQFDNKRAILDTLRVLSAQLLQAKQPAAADELNGWLALASLIKASPQLSGNDPQLTQWHTRFQRHPANNAFLLAYLANSPKNIGNSPTIPTNIAIFLPESGAYAQAAQAIKAGFMAAYARAEKNPPPPTIHFYDSEVTNPVTLYYKAINAGAQLIIGPLNKEHVEQLANVKVLEVPVLTLNHIPGLSKANLYQFALSPIDEVNQITHRAVNDGYKKALLLTPKTELGERMQSYFETALQKRGGTLLKAKHYKPDINDYSTTLKDLLSITESEKRYTQLKALVPDLQFAPRRRQDAEVVLITAYPQDAKVLQTQIQQLSQAYNMPIYATPQIFNGVGTSTDNDLNNITFCDIPWVFDGAYKGALSQEALRSTWQQFPEIYLRLIAMGIDAYNLIPHLSQLKTVPYNGATGKLSLTDENRVQRQLVCAKFNHAKPQPLESYVQSYEKNSGNPVAH
ncbi:MAG: penicillin-binding protein activator [Methylococcaceae bacterium]|nr:penicillin-binding protein activator [Methylococcaceae bacterium]